MQAGCEFKFIILRRDGDVTWEPLQDNRRWPANVAPGACVCTRFGEPGETVRYAQDTLRETDHRERPGERARHGQESIANGLGGRASLEKLQTSREPETLRTPTKHYSPFSRGKTGLRRRERILRSALADPNRRLTDFYELEPRQVGEGAFGVVCACHFRGAKNGTPLVVKTVVKDRVQNTKELVKEIEITALMDHPNCIRLFDSFEDDRSVYLILDACEGGELFDRIVEAGRFCEHDAAMLTRQMLRAVAFVHSVGVCHRDLKPENFLLLAKAPLAQAHLKLIDYGLAREFGDGQVLKSAVGTAHYAAPEVLSGRYTELCDLWSLGTIVFILLSGRPPFGGRNDQEVLRNARKAKYSIHGPIWACVSQDAKDFIASVLRLDAAARPTAAEGLEHPWIKSCAAQSQAPLPPGLVDNIQSWSRLHRFKRIALTVVAGQLNATEFDSLQEIFTSIDTNGDGHLTVDEIHEGLCRHGVSVPDGLRQILEELDSSEGQAGGISYSEFLTAAIDRRLFHQEELCWHAFKFFDTDNDGCICQAEVLQVLEHDLLGDIPDVQLVRETIAEMDMDGDGRIDFEEFMHMMKTIVAGSPFQAGDDRAA